MSSTRVSVTAETDGGASHRIRAEEFRSAALTMQSRAAQGRLFELVQIYEALAGEQPIRGDASP
jgi:hypothetical protein